MEKGAREILLAALALPIETREAIVHQLQESLGGTDPEVDRKWVLEIERRIAAFDRGESTAAPADEVFARVLGDR